MEGENGAGSASPTAPAEDEGIASLLYKNRLSAHSLKPGAPVVFAHANSPRNKPGWMTTLDTMKEKEISNLNRDSLLSVWSRSEGTFVLSRTAISPDSGSGRKVLPRVPPRGPRLVPPTSSPPLASSPSPPSEGPLAQGGSSPLGHRSAALRSFDASESEGEEDGRDGAQQGLSPSGVEEVVEWDGTPAAEDAAGAPDGGAREESASPSVEEAFEDAEDAPQEPAGHPPVEHLEGRDVGSFPTDGRLLELSKSEAQFLQDLHQVREEIDEVLNQSEPGVPGRRQVPAGPSESDGQHPAPTMPAGSGNAEHLEPAQPAGREHPGPAALSRPEISPRYTVREISRLAAGLESELEALEEENGRLRAREAERDREAARIQEEARAETEGLRKRIAELEAEATQAQRAAEAERQTATGLREGAGRAEKLASELDSERAKQVELTGKVAQMEEQLERAASAVAEAQGERDRAAAQLQSERSGRAKLEDRVVELESELEKARSAASTAQKDRDRAARELRQAADAKDEAEQKLAQAEEAASTAQKDYDRALTQLRQAVEAVESRLAKETKERTRVEAVKRNAQQELRKTRSELKDSEENVRQLIRKREEAAKVGDTTPEAEEQHDGSGRAATSESSSLAQAASSSSADPPAVPATPTSSGRASPASATCASLPPALSGSSTSAGNLSLPTPTTTPVRTASELLNPKELVRADVKHAWNVCKKRHAQTDRARSESVSSLGTARPQRDTVTEVDFDALGRRFNAKWRQLSRVQIARRDAVGFLRFAREELGFQPWPEDPPEPYVEPKPDDVEGAESDAEGNDAGGDGGNGEDRNPGAEGDDEREVGGGDGSNVEERKNGGEGDDEKEDRGENEERRKDKGKGKPERRSRELESDEEKTRKRAKTESSASPPRRPKSAVAKTSSSAGSGQGVASPLGEQAEQGVLGKAADDADDHGAAASNPEVVVISSDSDESE